MPVQLKVSISLLLKPHLIKSSLFALLVALVPASLNETSKTGLGKEYGNVLA